MSTPSLTAPPLVAIDTAPRANRGAPGGDAAPAAMLTCGGLAELDTPGGELTEAALGFTLAAAALGGRLPLGAAFVPAGAGELALGAGFSTGCPAAASEAVAPLDAAKLLAALGL